MILSNNSTWKKPKLMLKINTSFTHMKLNHLISKSFLKLVLFFSRKIRIQVFIKILRNNFKVWQHFDAWLQLFKNAICLKFESLVSGDNDLKFIVWWFRILFLAFSFYFSRGDVSQFSRFSFVLALLIQVHPVDLHAAMFCRFRTPRVNFFILEGWYVYLKPIFDEKL